MANFEARPLIPFANENLEQFLFFFALALGVSKVRSSEKNLSHFMESKNTTNLEAKTEQNINYPADFGGLSHSVGKFF